MEAIPRSKSHPSSNDAGDNPLIFEVGSNKKLTPNEVQGRGATYDQLTYSDPSLVGYWPFDEGSGTIAKDLSGNNNHGTLVNGPQWTSGKVGGALSFDGVNDYVAINDPFVNDQHFTIILWVNTRVLNDGLYHGFIGKQGDLCRKPGMWLNPSYGLHYDSWDNSCSTRYSGLYSNFFTSTNIWVFIGWAKLGNQYKFYRDGNIFQTASAPSNFYRAASSYWIGGVDNFWNGLIDEVRIYNRAL